MNLRILSLLAFSSLAAQGVEIYSNGPIVTHATGGFGLNPVSILQNLAPPAGLGNNEYGYGAQVGTNSLADDFAVHGTWTVNAIEVFGYATFVPAPSCTDVRIAIYNNRPDQGGVPIAGSPVFTNNLFTTAGYTVTNTMTTIRRAVQVSPLDNDRIVQSVRITLPAPLILNSGVYWLRFQYAGINFCPPVTTSFQNFTGFALQFVGPAPGTWSPVMDPVGGPGPQKGIPFKLYGSSTSVPGAIMNLGGGCDTASITVAGQPAMGGYVRAELGNLNPQHLPVIIVGFNDPNAPLGVCSCTNHATLDILNVGSVFSFASPMSANLVGFQFFIQGAQLDLASVGGAPCNLGLRYGLTDGYRWRAY
ncbi:MAG TPA: hypothetical protein VFD82_19015 [Planctomycetota bacterium]|nr:hypothetical protein [Planctomycetota bacterium]